MRCLWVSWSFMTWLSAMLCTGGCLLPYWLKGSLRTSKEFYSDLGLFRRCGYPVYGQKGSINVEHNCGHYDFHSIPHLYWQICLILLSLACCILFFLTFLLFFLGFCLDLLKLRGVHRSCQMGQFVAGILTIIACSLYPLGWRNNSEVQQICGLDVSPFNLGRCHIGWAFVLTCAGGLLSLLSTTLPFLMETSCVAGSLPSFPNTMDVDVYPVNGRRASSASASDTRKLAAAMVASSPSHLAETHCGQVTPQTGSTMGSLVNINARANNTVNSKFSYVSYHSIPNNGTPPCPL